MTAIAPRTLERLALGSVALALVVPAVLAAAFLTKPAEAPRLTKSVSREVVAPVASPPRALPASDESQPARVTAVIERPAAFNYGSWLWETNAADRATGQVVVTVDLRAQLLRVWRGGREIGVSTILYGAPDSPTPLGVFPVTQKDADHVSNIFHSPMPYSLRLTNDGVMVHASNVRSGWASNGCVGLPKDFARQLFDVVKLGDRVVITDGKPLLRVGDPLPVV